MEAIPRLPGSYLLVLHLAEDRSIEVGRMGPTTFRAGYYLYCGSARGPGGLYARIARYLRRDKRPHWHIDALLQHAQPREVWFVLGKVSWECRWSAFLQTVPGVRRVVPGFGASDCRCGGHLLYSASLPTATLAAVLSRACGVVLRRQGVAFLG